MDIDTLVKMYYFIENEIRDTLRGMHKWGERCTCTEENTITFPAEEEYSYTECYCLKCGGDWREE